FNDRNYATRIGVKKGKLGYMAPEYLNGEPVDARSDLFQLGVTLTEAIGGKRLFSADTPGRPRHADQMRAAIQRHVANAGALPSDLFELIVRLCSPDPKDRPASAWDVLAELERIAAG